MSSSERITANVVVDGVIMSEELRDAPLADQQAYAAKVKVGNRAFIAAVFALEDKALALGIDLDDLEARWMFAYFAPLLCTLGPVSLMSVGGYFATRHVRPENQS